MTLDEIDALTIAEVRAIAERASAALATLRDLGLMGGAAGAQPVTHASAPVVSPIPAGNPTRTGRRGEPTEDELAQMAAQRQALLAQNLPDEIQRAERTPRP